MADRAHGKKLFGDERGLVTIEFVIILPIILAAMFIVYEFGRALLAYEIASHDVRDATRYLSRAEAVDFTNTTGGYVLEAENLAKTGVATTSSVSCPADYPPSSSSPCHYPWTSSASISVTSSSFSSTNYNTDGTVMQMTASIPMTLSFLAFIGVPTAYTLTVSNTAQYIGD